MFTPPVEAAAKIPFAGPCETRGMFLWGGAYSIGAKSV
jgi:hypothetical protein